MLDVYLKLKSAVLFNGSWRTGVCVVYHVMGMISDGLSIGDGVLILFLLLML